MSKFLAEARAVHTDILRGGKRLQSQCNKTTMGLHDVREIGTRQCHFHDTFPARPANTRCGLYPMHAMTAAESHEGSCLSFICKHKHLWNADIMQQKVEKTQNPLAIQSCP